MSWNIEPVKVRQDDVKCLQTRKNRSGHQGMRFTCSLVDAC